MNKAIKHPVKKWEVSVIELKDQIEKRFKVTRRIPSLSVSETKFFKTKKSAKEQLEKWLK